MSGFDDLDGVVPDQFVDDTYLAMVKEASIITSNKDKKRYFLLKWLVKSPEAYAGEELTDMYRVASAAELENASDEDKTRIRDARRKRTERLLQLGVPRDEVNSVADDLDSLKGIEAYLTVNVRPKKDNSGDNIWINNVVLASMVEESDFLDSSNFNV